MRRLLALIVAAPLAFPATAATLTATPANYREVFAQTKDGDTVNLVGAFGDANFRGREFARQVTWNAARGTFGYWYVVGQKKLTVKGGRWFGIRFDGFDDIAINAVTVEGSEPRDGFGLWLMNGRNVTIQDSRLKSHHVGIWIGGVTGYTITRTVCEDMRNDCINAPDSHNGVVTWNIEKPARAAVPSRGEHQDFWQCWSIAGNKPVSNILIQFNTSYGPQGGANCYNSEAGGVDNIRILDNHFVSGFGHAVTVGNGRKVVIERNDISTSPTARPTEQARIILDRTDGVISRCGNRIGAWSGYPAVVDPPCK